MDHRQTNVYLQSFGFAAVDANQWNAASQCRPQVQVRLEGHSEQGSHTFYNLHCEIRGENEVVLLEWKIQRRLNQLREGLHDRVKSALGSAYATTFADAPFAKKGGFSGTSDRLKKWLQTLTSHLNSDKGAPLLLAEVLFFLDAPSSRMNVQTCTEVTCDAVISEGPRLGVEEIEDRGHVSIDDDIVHASCTTDCSALDTQTEANRSPLAAGPEQADCMSNSSCSSDDGRVDEARCSTSSAPSLTNVDTCETEMQSTLSLRAVAPLVESSTNMNFNHDQSGLDGLAALSTNDELVAEPRQTITPKTALPSPEQPLDIDQSCTDGRSVPANTGSLEPGTRYAPSQHEELPCIYHFEKKTGDVDASEAEIQPPALTTTKSSSFESCTNTSLMFDQRCPDELSSVPTTTETEAEVQHIPSPRVLPPSEMCADATRNRDPSCITSLPLIHESPEIPSSIGHANSTPPSVSDETDDDDVGVAACRQAGISATQTRDSASIALDVAACALARDMRCEGRVQDGADGNACAKQRSEDTSAVCSGDYIMSDCHTQEGSTVPDAVRHLEQMRPDEAADVLTSMPPSIAADLLLAMDETRQALVLEAMPCESQDIIARVLSNETLDSDIESLDSGQTGSTVTKDNSASCKRSKSAQLRSWTKDTFPKTASLLTPGPKLSSFGSRALGAAGYAAGSAAESGKHAHQRALITALAAKRKLAAAPGSTKVAEASSRATRMASYAAGTAAGAASQAASGAKEQAARARDATAAYKVKIVQSDKVTGATGAAKSRLSQMAKGVSRFAPTRD